MAATRYYWVKNTLLVQKFIQKACKTDFDNEWLNRLY